jgi:hypothetical protein
MALLVLAPATARAGIVAPNLAAAAHDGAGSRKVPSCGPYRLVVIAGPPADLGLRVTKVGAAPLAELFPSALDWHLHLALELFATDAPRVDQAFVKPPSTGARRRSEAMSAATCTTASM